MGLRHFVQLFDVANALCRSSVRCASVTFYHGRYSPLTGLIPNTRGFSGLQALNN